MKFLSAIPISTARQLLAILVAVAIVAPVLAEAPETKPAAGVLRVAPDFISLNGFNLQQQIQVTFHPTGRLPTDATRTATLELDDDRIATISAAGVIRGKMTGKTSLLVRLGKLHTRVPIVVGDPNQDTPPQFQRDILPILSKLGCNSGGCHGKQSGQNGFKLSVFGFDARADFEALTQEARGRRLFPADPGRSLLVRKATGSLPHGGGQRLLPDSVDQQILLKWIEKGTPWGLADGPLLEKITVQPRDVIMQTLRSQQLLVTALYSDGSQRDVTAAAAYSSNQATIADMDEFFQVKSGKQPGEAAITVNYMGKVTSTRIIIPRDSTGENLAAMPVSNPIDALVGKKLTALGLEPSPLADDAMFLRRLYLTAIGTLPSANEITAFLRNDQPDKRNQEIQRVLERDEYADYWTLKWADILMVNPEKMGPRGAYEFHQWLHQQIQTNRPYDQWVRELITASGNSGKYGPVNFFRAATTAEDVTKTVSQAFLGIRMDCAQCHHHPFEKWSQDDFYGMAGFFTGLQRKSLGNDRLLIFHPGHQAAKVPASNQLVPTQPPGGKPLEGLDQGDPRIHLASWMTAPGNPYFARLVANRLWKHYLGRGLVEPEDDLRSTNPAANEPLLNYLAQQVIQTGYDLKQVTRLILESHTFQLSSKSNALNYDDHQHHSHYLIRRLPAEVLLDAISQVTGSPETFVGMAPGTRAIELWDNRLPSYFLDTFGRSLRESPCECGKSGEPTMAQALHLMNAPEIDAKVTDPAGHARRLARTELSPAEITNQLCLTVLGKPATAREQAVAKALFEKGTRQAATADLMWTLINCYDFLFIH
ncbi:MAG: DUF1549 and DUF1553 domain-containing protein [Pirellulaceae bacterium]